jgi:hypothetical protein
VYEHVESPDGHPRLASPIVSPTLLPANANKSTAARIVAFIMLINAIFRRVSRNTAPKNANTAKNTVPI